VERVGKEAVWPVPTLPHHESLRQVFLSPSHLDLDPELASEGDAGRGEISGGAPGGGESGGEAHGMASGERGPSRVIMALGVPGRERAPVLPPTPYPRWGVRPEEQMVRFNHRIDPMQRIPLAPIQDVTAAATLARLHRDPKVLAKDQLQILAEASETCLQEEGK
jgi:hypothetical protein